MGKQRIFYPVRYCKKGKEYRGVGKEVGQAGEGMFVPCSSRSASQQVAAAERIGMLLLLFPAPGGGTSGVSPRVLGVAVRSVALSGVKKLLLRAPCGLLAWSAGQRAAGWLSCFALGVFDLRGFTQINTFYFFSA